MKKRAVSAVLWFFAGWFVGAMFAYLTGVSIALAPIVAVAAAALVAGDPRGIIWQPQAAAKVSDSALTPEPNPA
jgi:hypothetical protein